MENALITIFYITPILDINTPCYTTITPLFYPCHSHVTVLLVIKESKYFTKSQSEERCLCLQVSNMLFDATILSITIKVNKLEFLGEESPNKE